MATTTPKKEPAYKLSIDFGDGPVVSKGDTALEALSSLKRPTKITGKAFLVLEKGKLSAKRMFMPIAAKRLFFPNAQLYIAKQLDYLLK